MAAVKGEEILLMHSERKEENDNFMIFISHSLQRHVHGAVNRVRELERVDEARDGRLESLAVGELVRGELELGVVLEREGWAGARWRREHGAQRSGE